MRAWPVKSAEVVGAEDTQDFKVRGAMPVSVL